MASASPVNQVSSRAGRVEVTHSLAARVEMKSAG